MNLRVIDFTEQKDNLVSAGTTPVLNGTYNGNVTWATGSDGHAIKLDGKSYVDFGTDFANFSKSDSFSFGATIKPQPDASGAILSRMKDSNNYQGYDFLLSGGRVEVHIIHQWPENKLKVSTKNKMSTVSSSIQV